MRVKGDSVSLMGICPQIFFALGIAETIWRRFKEEVVITSGSEQSTRHSPTSLHYAGRAVDIRSRNLPDIDRDLVTMGLTESLGIDFGVFLEDRGTENQHFHIEWKPKRRS